MSVSLLLGCIGFVLFFLYDINSITRQSRLLGFSFYAGCILLVLATAADLIAAVRAGAIVSLSDYILLAGAVLSFAALIWCLFFAIPFDDTYVDPALGRRVCDTGVYALCRHPGVLCFTALYLTLGIAAYPAALLRNGMIFSALNVLYVILQDRITFPRTFSDYTEYRKRVPFLLPTKASIRRALRTMSRCGRKEDSK